MGRFKSFLKNIFTRKRYWHKLSRAEIDELIKNKTTWGYIVRDYRQPSWCTYPEALMGSNGCWSLTDIVTDNGRVNRSGREEVCREFCKKCDSSKDYEGKKQGYSSLTAAK